MFELNSYKMMKYENKRKCNLDFIPKNIYILKVQTEIFIQRKK